MSYKILVVDDEIMLTQLLSAHLTNEGYLVYTANNAEEAMNKLSVSPDLILLDINMPDMDGLELCRTIRSHLSCPILFLTARITEQDKVMGLMTGGDDYITKPFGLNELTARIAAHLRREARAKNSVRIAATGKLLVNPDDRTVSYDGNGITFSKREFDIVELLITHPGQVFDRERIYESIWGCDADGDNQVIKEHIRKIRAKLQKAAGKDYIETVWGVGYKWQK
uniref:response regulator transcription factor n=1 Tax=Agathobacter sp. TaxID=2021311 RepID=UPI004055A74D